MSHMDGIQNNEDVKQQEPTILNLAQWRPLNENP